MEYKINSMSIGDLYNLNKKDLLDLKPYYQRNDIWTRNDQESLIDSIKKGYPLPSFFIYQNSKGITEMVDGQQRARTIFRYIDELITDSKKQYFNSDRSFLNYELCITELFNISKKEEIEEFYVLVNRKGKHLTTSELFKAEYAGSNFLKLTEELLDYQNFMDLNLFTEAFSRRMADRNYIEELIAYLIHGLQDKKKIIQDIYDEDLSNSQIEILSEKFRTIIDVIANLNNRYKINETRYKQKNDFYTLFNFVNENIDQEIPLFTAQYRILIAISKYISPSIMDCPSLREYALHCVSQSNSKSARKARLDFFNSILLNKEEDISKNKILADVADYIDRNQLFDVEFEKINGYYLMKV